MRWSRVQKLVKIKRLPPPFFRSHVRHRPGPGEGCAGPGHESPARILTSIREPHESSHARPRPLLPCASYEQGDGNAAPRRCPPLGPRGFIGAACPARSAVAPHKVLCASSSRPSLINLERASPWRSACTGADCCTWTPNTGPRDAITLHSGAGARTPNQRLTPNRFFFSGLLILLARDCQSSEHANHDPGCINGHKIAVLFSFAVICSCYSGHSSVRGFFLYRSLR